ncbi:MAG TPA: hypothetical protein VLT60_08505 [Usitatibacter sp.]|nr:hypothetical protein [Usitatibacter sp.]
MNTPENDDIQRELEQRALRNVRGLVDRIEDQEALDKRTQKRYLVGLVVGAAVVLALLAAGLWIFHARQGSGLVIDTAKPAPAQEKR